MVGRAKMLAHLQAAVQFSPENQRAMLTAVDKHQDHPRHTPHWFSTEKLSGFTSK